MREPLLADIAFGWPGVREPAMNASKPELEEFPENPDPESCGVFVPDVQAGVRPPNPPYEVLFPS